MILGIEVFPVFKSGPGGFGGLEGLGDKRVWGPDGLGSGGFGAHRVWGPGGLRAQSG